MSAIRTAICWSSSSTLEEIWAVLEPGGVFCNALVWLRDIGFADVDCYWKWRELARTAIRFPAETPSKSL
jgi:hypothetical protein